MRVYFDTGFFVDYFSSTSIFTQKLRPHDRKGRTVGKIQQDAEEVLNKLRDHDGLTSICSIQEYAELQDDITSKYFSRAINKRVASRAIIRFESSKLMTLCEKSNISLIECDGRIIEDVLFKEQYSHLDFFDAIHIRTAVLNDADIMVTTDDELINDTGKFGHLSIVDSDQAIIML